MESEGWDPTLALLLGPFSGSSFEGIGFLLMLGGILGVCHCPWCGAGSGGHCKPCTRAGTADREMMGRKETAHSSPLPNAA